MLQFIRAPNFWYVYVRRYQQICTLMADSLRELRSAVREWECCFNDGSLYSFQNDFQVPLVEVPQIITRSKYPPRDPNLKDNWRGKARQDISSIDDQIIQVIVKSVTFLLSN